ncbi:MAG: M6 family metalloprotease domain-containing protein, partial [Chloroflexi bacterium]|nr:M6 family metalloprotease domain-containing protein [Chloroflexota bacterium]
MRKRLLTLLPIAAAVIMVLAMVTPALAKPPFPEGEKAPVIVQPPEDVGLRPAVRRAKPIDQPNVKDYLRNRQRQRLLEAGQTAEAQALQLEGTDRVLVILVEFAGTDVFTWEAGVSTWDPYGRANPNEAVYDAQGNVIVGNCSNIITQTTVFTYTGPAHNDIPRPLSEEDRSGDTIWTEDFSPEWFEGFLFGEGVTFHYTRVDGSLVHEDFTGQSVRDYFEDLSDGRYTITGDVIGWLQLPHSTWWYGADECPGARSGGGRWHAAIPGAGSARTLVTDALDAVNAIKDTIPGFDWANYDLDGNGIIDRLWIVHSGYGEEDSTTLLNRTDYSEASLWSHSSAISPPYKVAPGISAGPYIMMPENGGIGVFAHEYGHNLGADDLYAYDQGETSAGFWTLMADDWTGYPIGFEPPAVDPWHLDNWGWLDPVVITDPDQVYEVILGQASRFPGGEDMYRGVKIVLPEGVLDQPVPVWQGDYYWWGGKENLANAMMTTVDPIAIPAGGATLSFDLVYDIEDEWDFLWIQVSTVPSPEPSGVDWDTLTNENTQCEHDPSWIGGYYGFPVDLCGAGIGGFYGYNENWPDPEVQEFDLSAYAGQSIYLRFWYMTDWASLYSGAFVDNVKVTADTTVLFEDDAEAGDAKWDYQDPWQRSDGTQTFTHNFYLQWRNVGENGGYDRALGEPRWRFGPANSDLLVWYNNNFYTDNEVWHYLFDDPSFGPKGRMLVVDAHPDPYRDPWKVAYGYNNEGGNVTHRSQMRDAPFTVEDTVDFTMKPPYVQETAQFSGRPAVREFHDSMGYYPGAEYVSRGPAYTPAAAYRWVTKQWDASAVVPATGFYPLKSPGYKGTGNTTDQEFRFNCIPYLSGPYTGYLGCYWLGSRTGLGYDGGTGNPGDYDAQYGWHVKVIEQAADDSWGKVRIWNSLKELDVSFEVDTTEAEKGDELTYTCDIEKNIGSKVDALVVIPLDTRKVEYVPRSAFGGAVPVPSGLSPEELAKVYAYGGWGAVRELASSATGKVGSIVWIKSLATGQGADPFGFSVEVTVGGGDVDVAAYFFDNEEVFQVEEADTVTVTARIFLPLIFKSYTYVPPFEVTILHTNDFHGYLETDARGRGGSAYMAGKINDIRAEVGEGSVFLLDAGDVYLGAAPISQLLLGESAIDIYNMIGYDVAAYGNHEFDKGQDVLQTRTTQSEFLWVGANIVLEGTEWEHPTWTEPYVILSKSGVDLGIIGLITDETPQVTLKGTTEGLEFKDLTATVLHYYDEVKAQSDALIVLAHMGTEDSGPYKGLKTVAQELIAAGKPVDLMIGGHQHQALSAPVMVGDTAIVCAGFYGRWLGRADVSIDPTTRSLTIDRYQLITINNTLTPDPKVQARVAYWAEIVRPY